MKRDKERNICEECKKHDREKEQFDAYCSQNTLTFSELYIMLFEYTNSNDEVTHAHLSSSWIWNYQHGISMKYVFPCVATGKRLFSLVRKFCFTSMITIKNNKKDYNRRDNTNISCERPGKNYSSSFRETKRLKFTTHISLKKFLGIACV